MTASKRPPTGCTICRETGHYARTCRVASSRTPKTFLRCLAPVPDGTRPGKTRPCYHLVLGHQADAHMAEEHPESAAASFEVVPDVIDTGYETAHD